MMVINFPASVHNNPQGQALIAKLKDSIEQSIQGASVRIIDYGGEGGVPGATQPQPGAPLGRLPVGGAPPPLTGARPSPLPASPLGGGMTPGLQRPLQQRPLPQRPLPQRPMPTQRRNLV
jgi:hypothetical protein